jgi:mono/diheme cytochrome c family protein
MRRETTDLIGSGLLLAALVTATFATLAPTSSGASVASAAAVSTSSADIERGKSLFYAKGCVTCHRKNAISGAIGEVGPNLTGLAQRAADRKPGMSAQAYVRESLESPSAYVVPGFGGTIGMPDLGLNDDEIAALSAFLLGTD